MHARAAIVLAAWALAFPAAAAPPAEPATPAASPTAAVPAAGPLPVSAFFSDPIVSGAQLSPSGRWLAVLRTVGDRKGIEISDVQGQTNQLIAGNVDKNLHLDWVRWKGEDRLVVGLTYVWAVRPGLGPAGDILGWAYSKSIISLDRDGKNLAVLFKGGGAHTATGTGDGELLDILRGDAGHILAVARRPYGMLAAWRVDIHTGVAAEIESGPSDVIGWNTDRNGVIVARVKLFGRDVVIDGRAPGDKKWEEVTRIRPKDLKALADFELLAAAEGPGQLYVAVKPETPDQGAARAVRIYDFRTHTLGPVVWPALNYDVANIVTDQDTNALLGVCYWIDTYHCDFKDADMQANFRGLEKFFQGDRSLIPVSSSDDARWWVFLVTGPNDPSSYYLYDWTKKTMVDLGELYPDLPTERLGTMERFVYAARDGTQIPAYLTRPPGAPKGPLPLVVLPHGGPEVRDDFDFDTWSQFIATRGYLVLQPNYRGSGGYGVAYAAAGYGQWGGKMQDDITDGIKKLVDSGQVDPGRICIFGASYGGYAALIGGALQPDLYKCVVSWAGISDLEKLVKTERGGLFVGERSPAYDYDVKAIGDPDADKDRLARTSAVTYAAHYGPPVLLIHGDADTNVPIEQSLEMNGALKASGRDVRLIVVKGEDHSGWEPEHEQSALTAVADFISAHIAPAKLTPPPAPAGDTAPVAAAPTAPSPAAATSQPGANPQVQP